MRGSKKLAVLMLGWFSFFCFLCSPVLATVQVAPQWAQSVTAGSGNSNFNSITVDTSGNIYAAGYITGTGTYDFGNGVTVAGAYASGSNVVLVKYDSSGTAQWAKSVTAGSDLSDFYSITVDATGNIYAVGNIFGNSTYNFGNGVTVAGKSSVMNIVLVKYDSSGSAKWAKSVTSGSSDSAFYSVTLDTTGNLYAAGIIYGTGTCGFGNGVTVAGKYASGNNVVLVKYDSSGTAQWAKSVTAGSSDSIFVSVTVDATGNLYAAGIIYKAGTYNFGNGVTVAGKYASGNNVVLVKYDSSGTAQWAKSVTAGSNPSAFNSITVDATGNIYAVGYITGTGTYNFGDGVTVSGTSSSENIVLVKYDSSGIAQWAKSVTAGSSDSAFGSIVVDAAGNLYVAGYITGTGTYNFGNGVTVAGAYASDSNIVLVQYDSSGRAQWAKSVTSGSSSSYFHSITIDATGNLYAAGYIYGTGTYGFGSGVTVAGGGSSSNVLLVKYSDQPPTLMEVTKTGYENTVLNFAASDFINSFTGYLGNSLAKIKLISLPAIGALKVSGTAGAVNQEIPVGNISSLSYIPNTGYIGTDNFTWNGSDGLLYANTTADVRITINDQPPTLSIVTKSGYENAAITFTATDFSNSFSGYQGNALDKIKIVGLPSNGILKLLESSVTTNEEIPVSNLGNLTYIPNTGYIGSDSFGWNGSDGTLYATNAASVNLTINDQSPTLSAVNKSGYENSVMAFTATDFSNSFSGYQGNALDKIKIISLPSNGALKLSGSSVTANEEIPVSNLSNLTYTPNTGYIGGDGFGWNGSDGSMYATNSSYAIIVIGGISPSETSSVPSSVIPSVGTSSESSSVPSSVVSSVVSSSELSSVPSNVASSNAVSSIGSSSESSRGPSNTVSSGVSSSELSSASSNVGSSNAVSSVVSSSESSKGPSNAVSSVVSSSELSSASSNVVSSNAVSSVGSSRGLSNTVSSVGSSSELSSESSNVISSVVSSSESSKGPSNAVSSVVSSSELSSVPSNVVSSNAVSSVGSSSESSRGPSNTASSVVSSSELSSASSNVISSVGSSSESSSVPSNIASSNAESSTVSSSESSRIPSHTVSSVVSSSELSSVPSNIVSSVVLSSASSMVPSNAVSSALLSSELTSVSNNVDSPKGFNVVPTVGGVVGGAVGATVISACIAGGIYYYNHYVRPPVGKSVELSEMSLQMELGRM